MTTDVALLTERRYLAEAAAGDDWYFGNILRDDALLQAALGDLGLSSERVDWSDPGQDWSRFRCAVFRTTWDYFDRFAEFSAWLDRVQSLTRLCNPPSTVRWNLDKHYLADLETQGVPVVPSRFLERGSAIGLAELLDETGWNEAVVKPCVSGAARHTYRVDRANAADVETVVQDLLANESFLLQPFQRSIVEHGEDSLVMLGGRYSHAVHKLARAGDFRVQDDHGGTVHACTPTPGQVALAECAMAACHPLPAYGRVDMVQAGPDRFAVMELELIEPELWLRLHPPAAEAFAQGIATLL